MNTYEAQQAQIDRRRKLLEALQQQALAPAQTQVIGGRAVPYSPLQGLTQLAQAYLTKKGLSGLEEKEAGLTAERDKQRQAAIQKVTETLSGTPQQGGPLQYGPGEAYKQFSPEVKPDIPKAAIMAATDPTLADNQGLQNVTQAMLKSKVTPLSRPGYQIVPGTESGLVFDKSGGGMTVQPYPEGFTPAAYDVQRKGDIKGAETQAKLEVESAAAEAARRRGMPEMISMARDIMTTGKPTESGAGTLYDYLGSLFGYSPEGATEAAQLKAIGGALVGKMPRFEGPQSDADRQYYLEMAGQVGDPKIPVKQRMAALEVVESMWAKPADMSFSEYQKRLKEGDKKPTEDVTEENIIEVDW